MTGARSDTNQLNWPRWQQVLLIAVLVLVIGNRMTILLDTAAARAGIARELSWVGASNRPDPDKPGYVRVTEVAPGSPAARAGVMVGDYLTSERSYLYFTRTYVGERIDFRLDRHREIDPSKTFSLKFKLATS